MDQLRSLAGSKVADTKSKVEIPLDESCPEVSLLLHPEQPQIQYTDSQAATKVVPPKPQDLVPVSTSEKPQLQMPNVSTTEEPSNSNSQ